MDSSYQERVLARWQRALLPLMSVMVIGMTVVFVALSTVQMRRVQSYIQSEPQLSVDSLLPALLSSQDDAVTEFSYTQFRALLGLELHSMQRRHHQANLLVMSRTWTRYMGFLTGMILALIGAAFVLGKLQESETKAEGGAGQAKVAFQSSSPGLVLAFLGTVLMIVALYGNISLQGTERAVYLPSWISADGAISEEDSAAVSEGSPDDTLFVPRR